MAAGHDQQSGGDQLMSDVSGRPRVPRTRRDAGRLSEHLIMAIGDLTQLGDGFIEAAPPGGVPHGGAVEGAVEQLILGAHTPAYRMYVR
jgi:hypothetical protein